MSKEAKFCSLLTLAMSPRIAAICLLLALASPVQAAVGMMNRPYTDPHRQNWSGSGPRPLTTLIWYPADQAPATETLFDAPGGRQFFVRAAVAGNGPISNARRRYPLVVLSHGTGGSAVMLFWLGRELARNGYIAAAVNHHGNTAAERELKPQGFLLYWERPADLSRVLDHLLADPIFGPRIDRSRIAAAGFSLGGYSVIALGGGRFNARAFESFCASKERDFTCGPQPELPDAPARFEELKRTDPRVQASLRHSHDSYRDHRIRAIFAIAPALGGGFTAADLRDVRVPVEIVVGSADQVTPPRTNALRYAKLLPDAKVDVLRGPIGHYTFLHECTDAGKAQLDICRDDATIDRARVHEDVASRALKFFRRVLRTR
jgi:predicted dienelactone hydrolase